MMTVEIRDLTFECIIGILDFERTTPQRVVVDATMEYAYSGDFLDYAAVAAEIRKTMQERRFQLIEEALAALNGVLKAQFSMIKSLSLTISKPDILPDCRVCVSQKSFF